MGFFLGLDLGQAADFTALAALESHYGPDPMRPERVVRHYACRWLRRWDLGTKYPEIVAEIAELTGKPPLAGSVLGVDQTGVGAAVVDMFSEASLRADLRPVLITTGHAVTSGTGALHVPKKELVSTLQTLLQTGRLKIAPELEHAETLRRELLQFRTKITAAGNETFESWRERDHDDLVLALAIAAFLAEREPSVGVGMEGLFVLGVPGCQGRPSRLERAYLAGLRG